MKQYIDKSALVAEIERRKQTWKHQDQQYVNGGKDVCDYLLGFIDSLEEKLVSEDLKEGAKNYSNNLDNIYGSIGEQTKDAFKAGAQWAFDYMKHNLNDFRRRNNND